MKPTIAKRDDHLEIHILGEPEGAEVKVFLGDTLLCHVREVWSYDVTADGEGVWSALYAQWKRGEAPDV